MIEFDWPFDSTDPTEWAAAFCRIYHGQIVELPGRYGRLDQETMATWFEQAMQAGRNAEAAGY
jgi:hypothetical protein